MDNGFEETDAPGPSLSYDDSVPYAEQVASLAERISSTKVYLLSDASKPRRSRPTHGEAANGGGGDGEDEMDTDQVDPALRPNAILLQGPPVAHLPTGRIFDYAAHFDIHPLGLEWVDDNTCVFVFASKALARSAFLALQKPPTAAAPSPLSETPPTMELTTARAIPIALWPPEDRIHHSLGVGQGLKETIHMRWARVDDKKKRGAKKDSAFYRKHGVEAGKESAGFGVVPASATVAAAASAEEGGDGGGLARRLAPAGDTLEGRIATDGGDHQAAADGVREWDLGKPGSLGGKRKRGRRDEVDEFLGDDLDDEEPAAPPSKMRSDYIAQDGRTARTTARLPRRARGRGGKPEEGSWLHEDEDTGSRRRGGRRRGRNRGADAVEPPRKKTREELDKELDAFLNDRD